MNRLLALAVAFLRTTSFGEEPKTFDVGPFTFKSPANWKWVPVTSTMRKAQLNVPSKSGGAEAEVTFFVFGSGAGGVDANIQRWMRQFDGKADVQKVERKEIAGTGVTFAATEGTFQSGMPGAATTPLEGYALRGAVLEAGEELVFIKMTGPAEVVKGAEAEFTRFISDAAATRKK